LNQICKGYKRKEKAEKEKEKEEIKIEKGPRGTHLARPQNQPMAQLARNPNRYLFPSLPG
jgi:hypothetical protein